MPLQTSRYLMSFAFVILCICGLTLVDQLPGIALNLRGPRPSSSPPVRTAHTLQPLPPAEPVWNPAVLAERAAMDYPDLYEAPPVPIATVSYSREMPVAEPFVNEPVAVAAASAEFVNEAPMDWSLELPPIEPAAPAGSFSDDDFSDFELGAADLEPFPVPEVPSVEVLVAQPAIADFSPSEFAATEFSPFDAPKAEVPAPRFPVAQATELPADDGVLGKASNEPWEWDAAVPATEAEFGTPGSSSDSTLTEPSPGSVSDVKVLGFSDAEPSATTEPAKPGVIQGSYRIRMLTPPQQTPQRLNGTFRFGGPPVEVPAAAVQQRPVCRHQRNSGHKVCPHCGVIRK